jgi:ABC-type branched-subunit amino acid transport system substrate-binding protein
MGQTRDTTLSAADILGTHNAIPMVVSSPTGNKFASKGAVFMTGPSDARQAEVAADFIRSTPQLSSSQNYIVFDPADPYSADLDRSYASALATRQLATASQESYAAGSSDVLDQLQADVNDICRHSTNGAHPLIIYAGRANEFPTFLLHLEDSDCGSRAVLIGDDDFTQTETENYLDLTQLKLQDFANGRVYYTSAGAACLEPAQEAAGACMLNAKSPQRDQFSALYTQAAHEQSHDNGAAFRTGWNGEIMLAFDSVGLVLDATGRVRLPSASDMPNRQQVLRQLQGTTGTAAYQGIAGTIAFGPAANPADPGAGGVDTTKQVVIQVIREQPTGQTRLLPEPAYTEPQP